MIGEGELVFETPEAAFAVVKAMLEDGHKEIGVQKTTTQSFLIVMTN